MALHDDFGDHSLSLLKLFNMWKPYACVRCGASYHTAAGVNTHAINAHTGLVVACTVADCGNRFESREEMLKHITNKHSTRALILNKKGHAKKR